MKRSVCNRPIIREQINDRCEAEVDSQGAQFIGKDNAHVLGMLAGTIRVNLINLTNRRHRRQQREAFFKSLNQPPFLVNRNQ